MGQLACVNVPALPLQLLLREHAEWARSPVVVVEHDKPQGLVMWVNEPARRQGVLPGMRYATALALAAGLRAGILATEDIECAVAALSNRFREFTPNVEPSYDEPGVFWLDASGLAHLHASHDDWARQIHRMLGEQSFTSIIVVGHHRFSCYALAKSMRQASVAVFDQPERERLLAHRVPLDRLGLDPEVRDTLAKLGIRTVGQMLRLAPDSLLKRFGPMAHRFHRAAANQLWEPLRPQAMEDPLVRHLHLDHPETDMNRLLFVIKQLLDALLAELVRRHLALTELVLCLCLYRSTKREQAIRTAEATLDVVQILGLVRLRLESIHREGGLEGGVTTLALEVFGTPATQEQLRMFTERPRRDLTAAARAFACIRASWGDDSVVVAEPANGHLPEASFSWQRIDRLPTAKPREPSTWQLVRTLRRKPLPLPVRPAREPDGWLLRGHRDGAVTHLVGPYYVSGGWWRQEITREYYFAEMKGGDLLWIYYDCKRRQWFLQGQVA